VLDESLPVRSDEGLPSVIQRFWDTRGKHSKLMLVLCGSQVSFMEREVLAERSPLFGRRTAQRRLEPLLPRRNSAVLPALADAGARPGVRDPRRHAGVSAALRRRALAVRERVARSAASEGYLFDEVQFLLRSELSNPATYNSILAAIARGSEKSATSRSKSASIRRREQVPDRRCASSRSSSARFR
jgi:AAA+ ATPase superfamily predicted ATPase